MNIMVVDDSKTARALVVRHLELAGFEGHTIREFENGVSALHAARENKPDVILCDWNMPFMNGLDLLKMLSVEKLLTVFGFVTSECTDTQRDQALSNGASFYITKPYDTEKFRNSLKDIIN